MKYFNCHRRLIEILLIAPLLCTAPARCEVLSGREFQNLLASGPEGTTILFQGGTDKVFYSPTLKNRLRLAPELGPEFIKQKILQNTLAEGYSSARRSRAANGTRSAALPPSPPTATADMAC
jgi:hypothetical protein